MIDMSVKNDLAALVANNIHQGDDIKAVCVCTAGSLRSQTLAEMLVKRGGFNPRACGTADFAIIPLSVNLLHFHDVIFCMEFEHLRAVRKMAEEHNIKVAAHVLGVEDIYYRNEPRLIDVLETRLQELGYFEND